MGIYEIRDFSVKYSEEKSKERKKEHISLEKKLIQLELHLTNNSANDELKKTYENCKTKLEELYDFFS